MPPHTRVRVRAPKPSSPDASDDDEAPSDSSHEIVGNNPDAIPTKKQKPAEDIKHFYDRIGDPVYCRPCR